MGSRRKGRIIAFQSIFAWDFTRCDNDILLDFQWLDESKRSKLDEETITFSKLLIAGTIDKIAEIDESIKKKLEHWDFKRLAKVDLAILRMSVYSLIYQKDIPPSVTIDEAIDIAKEFGNNESYRFINGVLDGIRKLYSLK